MFFPAFAASFPPWQRSVVLAVALLAHLLPGCSADTPPEGAQAASQRSYTRVEATGQRALAPSGRPYSEDRAACRHREPLRRALWGETHVHTNLSMDAWMWDVRATPDDAYRFARGESIHFPPLDDAGRPTRAAKLERPLDFAAVTDHASFMGEVAMCTRPGSAYYDTDTCRLFRGVGPIPDNPLGDFGVRMSAISSALDAAAEIPARTPALCGADGRSCIDSMDSVWRELQASAERNYDRSRECRFTTFHAYEYTATPALAKVHHNVLFRNASVPASPPAYVDTPDVYDLWQRLTDECLEAGTGCDVLTIPHNSNLSNGRMFVVTGKDLPLERQRERARMRRDIETIVEISQIKGDSECRNGLWNVVAANDEFCGYEEWRGPQTEDCREGTSAGALLGKGCVSRRDYIRTALIEGLREQERLGVNPYKLGIIAATDAHNANPGDAEEYSYQGWSGTSDMSPALRNASDPGAAAAILNPISSPGGLAGVWAEENSRDALFDAMQRRETFGTSGPRITARLFGGWDFPAGLCGAEDLVAQGYANGVAMGGDLPPRPAGAAAPTFVVSAWKDPGISAHPGGLLQRAQIIKGWVGADGRFQQKVYDVAGGSNSASVDLNTCKPRGPGHDSLCRVWRDPDFDVKRAAVYYLRVLENPSCRWNQWECIRAPQEQKASLCAASAVPRTIQERLWSSPIWYDPSAGGVRQQAGVRR